MLNVVLPIRLGEVARVYLVSRATRIPAARVVTTIAVEKLADLMLIGVTAGLLLMFATLPDWLQPVAEWNPTSTLTASLRELWGNPNPYATDSFPSQEPILVTLVWVVMIVALFGTLAVRRYRSMSR